MTVYAHRWARNWIYKRLFMMKKCMATLSKRMIRVAAHHSGSKGRRKKTFGLGVDLIVLSRNCQMQFIVSRTPTLQDAEW
jgi:hypothetical protein